MVDPHPFHFPGGKGLAFGVDRGMVLYDRRQYHEGCFTHNIHVDFYEKTIDRGYARYYNIAADVYIAS